MEENENSSDSGHLLSGIQAVRLFWSVHNERRRSSQIMNMTVPLPPEAVPDDPDAEMCRFENSQFCRICRQSDDNLVENVCACKGSMSFIHERCLRMWTKYQRSEICEVCRTKFNCNFEPKLSDWTLTWNFVRRRYFGVLVRDFLNFMVLFGISILQNTKIVSMLQLELEEERVNPFLPIAIIGATFYDIHFSRWVMRRTLKACNLVREYWALAHDEEFLGYFNPDYAVFGEDQAEIEEMLLAEYESRSFVP
ncbi:uncharacterized protein LOC129740116 isoform X2 [Uranotaenia lowii]|uniref:uncharacterized protein LOC129740116 isoform X2 n=1 Tax=Uranotaenia lowii TaxID=190385 RepID=UPI002479F5F0|nr:uncharacterized protein LOC129740116 isoform X2 [Uranotaenia lowii]